MYPLALDVRARGLPDFERLGVVAEIDADFLEDGVRIGFEQREALLAQDLVVGNIARDVGDRGGGAGGTRSPLRIAAAWAARVTGLRLWLIQGRSPERCEGPLIPAPRRHGFTALRPPVWSLSVYPADQFASRTCHDAPSYPAYGEGTLSNAGSARFSCVNVIRGAASPFARIASRHRRK